MKYKRLAILFGVLTLLMIAFIWGNSVQSRDQSSGQSLSLLGWLKPLLDPQGRVDEEIFHVLIRKAAHFAEFGALGLYVGGFTVNLGRLKGRRYVALPLLLTLWVAVMDEFIQLFSNRGSQVSDVMLDYAGALAGLLAVALLCRLLNYKRKGE